MARRGSTRRWRQLRAAILTTTDTCWICGQPGADQIDHVIPIAQRPDLEYDLANLRPAHGMKRPGCVGNLARTPRRQKPNRSRDW